MKILESSIKTILLLALGLWSAHSYAQNYQISSQQEGATKSSYTLKAGGDQAKVELTNAGSSVFVHITSMKNETIGKGTISADASANPKIKLEDVRKGTLPYWKFALDHIELSPNKAQKFPSAKARARAKCREYCKDKILGNQTVKVAMLQSRSPGGYPPVLAAQINPLQMAFAAYLACMKDCMKRAREKYQNQKSKK